MHIDHQSDPSSVTPPSRSRVLVSGADTDGHMALIELSLTCGDSCPRHVHTQEDQLIYVLDGQLTVNLDEAVDDVGAGARLWLLRGSDFSYQVRSAEARLLLVAMPSGIEGYYRELDPISTTDPGRLVTTAARYGITITGPGPSATP